MNRAKRITDIILSLIIILLVSPLMAAAALAIKITSCGPVFFMQKRVGKDKKCFTFYKFRSMYMDADQKAHEKFVAEQIKNSLLPQKNVYKMLGDVRVTVVGHWLRKTSIDELPQLFNVLKGDMSLVGPRPPIPYELDHYGQYEMQRLSVVPGITGLWQVSGRSMLTYKEMIDLDIKYISAQCWINDIIILAKTVFVVFHIGKAG